MGFAPPLSFTQIFVGHKYQPAGQFPLASGGLMFPPFTFINSFLDNFFMINIIGRAKLMIFFTGC